MLSAPRGLTKLLILHLASTAPVRGTDVAELIASMTGGVWRPSPGSVYYVLGELSSRGLLEELPRAGGERRYVASAAGLEELSKLKSKAVRGLKRQLVMLSVIAEVADDGEVAEALRKLAAELEGGEERH